MTEWVSLYCAALSQTVRLSFFCLLVCVLISSATMCKFILMLDFGVVVCEQ